MVEEMRTIVNLMPAPVVVGLLLTVGALSAPIAVEAQVRIVGHTVADGDESPIEGVAVTVVSPDGDDLDERFTDSEGRFIVLVQEGLETVRLRAERIGYETVLTPPIDLERYSSINVQVRLAPEAVPMAPLEVVAGQRTDASFMHQGFRQRKELGLGQYITREEIERRSPSQVTDLLRTLPGVRLNSSARGSHSVVTMARGQAGSLAGGQCPAQVYVDDFHVNKAGGWTFRIDDVVSPGDVEGIEVYKGLATVPAEFLSPRADCGVVVIWTRRRSG